MRHITRLVILAALPAVVALAACGGDQPDPDPPAGSTGADSPEPQESVSRAPTTPADQSPAPTEENTAPEVDTFELPDLAGMNLQDAQDTLQSLGSFLMDQQDATGEGRTQVVDSNWQVCTQEPAAGTTVDLSAVVKLAVVKLDEICP